MTAAPSLWMFFLLVLGVIALPGMDMAFVAGSAAAGGRRGGAAALAGVVAGGLVHVGVAATGVAVLLTRYPAAFNALLVLGALYMAWLGVNLWRSPAVGVEIEPGRTGAWHGLFGRGLATCLLNPKAYVFMLAVFPAFVVAPEGGFAVRALQLAAVIALTQAAVYGAVVVGVLSLRGRRSARLSAGRLLPRIAGSVLIAAALTAFAGRASAQPVGDPQAHAFDTLYGEWHVANRKRVDMLSPDAAWEGFDAVQRVHALPGGVGNVDEFVAAGWRPGFVGVTLRLYNPQTRRWSLYWLTNRDGGLDAEGRLGAPLVGAFDGRVGRFEGIDRIAGREVRVRYGWRFHDADHARWEQAFSLDEGATWFTNWTMDFTRTRLPAA